MKQPKDIIDSIKKAQQRIDIIAGVQENKVLIELFKGTSAGLQELQALTEVVKLEQDKTEQAYTNGKTITNAVKLLLNVREGDTYDKIFGRARDMHEVVKSTPSSIQNLDNELLALKADLKEAKNAGTKRVNELQAEIDKLKDFLVNSTGFVSVTTTEHSSVGDVSTTCSTTCSTGSVYKHPAVTEVTVPGIQDNCLQRVLRASPKHRLIVSTHRRSGKSWWTAMHAYEQAKATPDYHVVIVTGYAKDVFYDQLQEVIHKTDNLAAIYSWSKSAKHIALKNGSTITVVSGVSDRQPTIHSKVNLVIVSDAENVRPGAFLEISRIINNNPYADLVILLTPTEINYSDQLPDYLVACWKNPMFFKITLPVTVNTDWPEAACDQLQKEAGDNTLQWKRRWLAEFPPDRPVNWKILS